jgi:hypothetical protein
VIILSWYNGDVQPIETYPVNIPSERSKDGSLFQALTKTAGELFPRGLRDGNNKPVPVSDLEWWKITDDIDTTTVIACPKDAYPDGFRIQRDLEHDSYGVEFSGRAKGPFDTMSWKLTKGEESTMLSMVAHRVGYPPKSDEFLNVVERLHYARQEVIALGLFDGIFVICCGCHGEAGKRNSAVYGWNMDIPGVELNRRPITPIYVQSPRDILKGFSRN